MKPDRLPSPAINKNYFRTEREEFNGNQSGLEPIGTKVLVLTDSIGDTTTFGLAVTADMVERMTLAITTGVIVAIGGGAFSDWPNSDRKWPGLVPKVGDRVIIAKYAGLIQAGKDGKHYRYIHDTDVCGFEVGESKPQVFAAPKGVVQ